MASSGDTTGLCPDWVLSTMSDVHIARDRAWFSTYTPFNTFTTTLMQNDGVSAIGIGDVEIPVKLFPKRSGPRAHGTLRLRNVLHIPTARCNIIGGPQTDDYEGMQLGALGDDGRDAAIMNGDGQRLGYFTRTGGVTLWCLKLSGPPIGPVVGRSLLDPNGMHMIHAFWPESERRRWEAAQSVPGPAGNNRGQETAPYSKREKDWLNEEWGGEYKFLTSHGLSIYKDDDREEGRRIARAMMRNDGDDEDMHNDEDDEDMDDGEGEDSGSDLSLEGHFADYHFTSEELDFIENGWGNSQNFMLQFGLKFYKDEDCEEAKAIVRALMVEHSDVEEAEISDFEGPSEQTRVARDIGKREREQVYVFGPILARSADGSYPVKRSRQAF